jgi:hypothetical protein
MPGTYDALRISFNPKHLRRLMPFKASNDIRYYLCGIHVSKAEQGGIYLVATDGHCMAVVYDKEGSIEGFDSATFKVTPACAVAAKSASTLKNKGIPYRLLVEGQRVKIATGFSETAEEWFIQPGPSIIDDKFPEFRKVIPDFSKLKRGALAGSDAMNAKYLARIEKVDGLERFAGVEFWQQDNATAVVCQLQHIPELLIVLMPMRGTDETVARAQFQQFALPNIAPAAPTTPMHQPSDAEPVPA